MPSSFEPPATQLDPARDEADAFPDRRADQRPGDDVTRVVDAVSTRE
jgi:hypothetical protein